MARLVPKLFSECIEYKGQDQQVWVDPLVVHQMLWTRHKPVFLKNLNLHAFSRSFSITLPKMVRDEQFTKTKLPG